MARAFTGPQSTENCRACVCPCRLVTSVPAATAASAATPAPARPQLFDALAIRTGRRVQVRPLLQDHLWKLVQLTQFRDEILTKIPCGSAAAAAAGGSPQPTPRPHISLCMRTSSQSTVSVFRAASHATAPAITVSPAVEEEDSERAEVEMDPGAVSDRTPRDSNSLSIVSHQTPSPAAAGDPTHQPLPPAMLLPVAQLRQATVDPAAYLTVPELDSVPARNRHESAPALTNDLCARALSTVALPPQSHRLSIESDHGADDAAPERLPPFRHQLSDRAVGPSFGAAAASSRPVKRSVIASAEHSPLPTYEWRRKRYLVNPEQSLCGLSGPARDRVLAAAYLLFSICGPLAMAVPAAGEAMLFTVVLLPLIVLLMLPHLDRTLVRLLAATFNTWYLAFNVACLMGAVLAAGSHSTPTNVSVSLFFLLQTALTALLDASDVHQIYLKLLCCAFLIMGSVQLIVLNAAPLGTAPFVTERSLGCYLDTNRLASGSAAYCLLYAARFMFLSIRFYLKKIAAPCTIALPVVCDVATLPTATSPVASRANTPPDSSAPSSTVSVNAPPSDSEESATTSAAEAGAAQVTHVQVAGLQTEDLAAFFGHAPVSPTRHRLTATTATPAAPAAENRTVRRRFLFRPLNSWSWFVTFGQSRAHRVSFGLALTAWVATGLGAPTSPWVQLLLGIAALFYLAVELTRYDRTLVYCLCRCSFEFWLLNFTVLQHLICNLYWKSHKDTADEYASTASLTVIYCLGSITINAQDAGPAYPLSEYRMGLSSAAVTWLPLVTKSLSFISRFSQICAASSCWW